MIGSFKERLKKIRENRASKSQSRTSPGKSQKKSTVAQMNGVEPTTLASVLQANPLEFDTEDVSCMEATPPSIFEEPGESLDESRGPATIKSSSDDELPSVPGSPPPIPDLPPPDTMDFPTLPPPVEPDNAINVRDIVPTSRLEEKPVIQSSTMTRQQKEVWKRKSDVLEGAMSNPLPLLIQSKSSKEMLPNAGENNFKNSQESLSSLPDFPPPTVPDTPPPMFPEDHSEVLEGLIMDFAPPLQDNKSPTTLNEKNLKRVKPPKLIDIASPHVPFNFPEAFPPTSTDQETTPTFPSEPAPPSSLSDPDTPSPPQEHTPPGERPVFDSLPPTPRSVDPPPPPPPNTLPPDSLPPPAPEPTPPSSLVNGTDNEQDQPPYSPHNLSTVVTPVSSVSDVDKRASLVLVPTPPVSIGPSTNDSVCSFKISMVEDAEEDMKSHSTPNVYPMSTPESSSFAAWLPQSDGSFQGVQLRTDKNLHPAEHRQSLPLSSDRFSNIRVISQGSPPSSPDLKFTRVAKRTWKKTRGKGLSENLSLSASTGNVVDESDGTSTGIVVPTTGSLRSFQSDDSVVFGKRTSLHRATADLSPLATVSTSTPTQDLSVGKSENFMITKKVSPIVAHKDDSTQSLTPPHIRAGAQDSSELQRRKNRPLKRTQLDVVRGVTERARNSPMSSFILDSNILDVR